MPRSRVHIRPVSTGVSQESPSLYIGNNKSPQVYNCNLEQNSLKRRWGYVVDRNPGGTIHAIIPFQLPDGTKFTCILTGTDLCVRETGTGGTFSYKTQTYTTGTITNITGATVTGSSTDWVNGGIAAGDKFILDADHSSTIEPDVNWATVSTVAGTSITLSGSYTGTTGNMSTTYKIRQVYSVPSNESWSWAIVNDKLCFTNGDTAVQSWAGTGYSAAVDATNALKARYCTEYANRLIIADCYNGSTRMPNTFKWSKEGSVTDWTDSTAGQADVLDTDGYIMGLGKTGPSMVIFKQDNFLIYGKTGIATSPIQMTSFKQGIGLTAPYSVIPLAGNSAFVGRDDFYVLDGDVASSLGGSIRDYVFSHTGAPELRRTFAGWNADAHQILWGINTDEGKIVFVFDYRYGQWLMHRLSDDVTCFGRGVI